MANKITVVIPETVDPFLVFGPQDQILRAIEKNLEGIQIGARGALVTISGPESETQLVQDLLEELMMAAEHGHPLSVNAVEQALRLMLSPEPSTATAIPGTQIRPKTPGQSAYMQAISDNRIIFGIGPAGTGKTYLAMAKAVEALGSGQVKRIVLTRPAVEAGESLGFLPGSLTEKIDPYLRPLYDALRDMIEPTDLAQLMEAGTIEVAPLAYMRGRTLSHAFIVLDEAQNTTGQQMKMFLTRLGQGSTMVVTGDITQIDLPARTVSGLHIAQRVLPGIAGLEFCYLTSQDVVRDRLVTQIIEAYEQAEH